MSISLSNEDYLTIRQAGYNFLRMTEEEFVSSRELKPFGTADLAHLEAQGRRTSALGVALWGRTADDLQRQLLAPYPEIPSGYDLADFRRLLKTTLLMTGTLPGLPLWKVRCEIVRRAIEYLESR